MPAAIGSPSTASMHATLTASSPQRASEPATETGTVTATTVPARASHFICWRRSPCARRNRMTAEAAEPTMPIASRSTESPVSGSISAVSMPNGLSTVGWSSSGPGGDAGGDEGARDPRARAPGDPPPPRRQQVPVGEQQQHERAGDEDERDPRERPVPGRQLPEPPRALVAAGDPDVGVRARQRPEPGRDAHADEQPAGRVARVAARDQHARRPRTRPRARR